MPPTALIYGLLDPRTNELRYIGKTISKRRRVNAHRSEIDGTPRAAWILELKTLGLEPKFIVFSEVPFDEWQKQERETIARYRRLGCPLLNVRAGGGANHDLESKASRDAA